jgi:hypothetical protein
VQILYLLYLSIYLLKEEIMKRLLFSGLCLVPLCADMQISSLKLTTDECLTFPYANHLGPTIHSRYLLEKKLKKEAYKMLSFTEQEARKKIQERYPALRVSDIEVVVKHCYIYFKANSAKNAYYFDAGTLSLIQRKEQ